MTTTKKLEGKKSMCIVKLSSFFVSFQSWRVGRGNASNPSHCQRKLGYNLAGYILGFKPITTNTREDLSTKPLRQKKGKTDGDEGGSLV